MVKKAAQATPNHLLRQARLEHGWTQKEVANRIGAPLDLNVTRWERGTAKPSAYYVQRLCELFGMSAGELGLLPPQPSLQEAAVSSTPALEPAATFVKAQRLWNVPFKRNPFFTGRVELLHRLHELLHRDRYAALTQSYALTGLGGIGKTQTAVEYAYRYRDDYDAIFWVRATSWETLVTDFVSVAHLLALPGQDASDQMLIVATVKRWLAQKEGWLLILDNADDLAQLSDFLPTGAQGHVLLTTRAQATGKIAESLSVEKMDVSEAMLLLLRRARCLPSDAPLDNAQRRLRNQAQVIVENLDGLPLALDQAGAYIEETGCSLSDYLDLYQRRRSTLLKRQSSVSDDYPHTVASTWSLAFGQVEQADPAAAELLRLCAFLAPDAIPEAMLAEGAAELGSVLGPVVADPFLLNEAIQVLRRYSLIKRDPEARLLNLHRLVQVVHKDSLEDATRQQWAERTIRAVNAAFPEADFAHRDRCERYLPHAQSCADLIDEYRLSLPEAAHLLHQVGRYLSKRVLLHQAEPYLLQALHIYEQVLGSSHPETASVLNDLAELYYGQGRGEKSGSLFQRSLAIREQALDAHHPDVAESLSNLGQLYHHQGKYQQAEAFYLRALAIWEHPSGSGRLDVKEGMGFTLNNLALLYHHRGHYEQAEPLHLRALHTREQALGAEHPDTAESLNNLAFLYGAQGKYEQAEQLLLRAVRILEQALGPEYPDTAMSIANLAQMLTFQGRYEEAEPLHLRALRIRENVLGPEHFDTSYSLSNLALLYRHQEKYEQAEQLYRQALRIREQVLGPEHPRVAQTLSSLAQVLTLQGRHEEAESLYQRALALFEQSLGPEHPDTVATRKAYAEGQHLMR